MTERCEACIGFKSGLCNSFFSEAARLESGSFTLIQSMINILEVENSIDTTPVQDLIYRQQLIGCGLETDEILERLNKEVQA